MHAAVSSFAARVTFSKYSIGSRRYTSAAVGWFSLDSFEELYSNGEVSAFNEHLKLGLPIHTKANRIKANRILEELIMDTVRTQELSISGMTCGHCRAAVESALREVPGVTAVEVNLDEGRAKVQGAADLPSLVDAVEEAGYEASPTAAL